MLALILLWVGAVLLLNGIWLFGLIADREISVINFFSGGVILIAALVSALRAGAQFTDISFGALVFLFAFTYLWVGLNPFLKADGRGLGWYCLFVAITALPIGIETLRGADSTWLYWLGANWIVWSGLWFLYWLLLVAKRVNERPVGVATIATAIATAWLPGYLLLRGYMAL